MSVVPGDPGSFAAAASTLAAAGRRLGASAPPLATALADLGEGWAGRVSVHTRRRGADLAEATTSAATELERVARLLQDRAGDLSELHARGRALHERAATAGLELRDGRVVPGYGVRGEADEATDAGRRERAVRLQGELDLLLAQHRRRRDFVLDELRASAARLTTLSDALRRG
ncbi:hypothetical protein H9L10_02935 [Phycicoccus endophyticus]|uniref:Uncharacterized protein n=1 Tax=Phycicoccus endophyticus TaxID=1690220 RepID=A0A7G9R373_9MICO|nr:hypothetical protein [Phycicoccus endophyticus]NHI19788.1 hypothetical protein [Phycicoccus endophyticus]QNN50048.1 hypothetical protein H9L10_02935 [Phycicoccus endophyticus]GGL28573.1 hypothetical protein GCM10012283_08500 [Phycicoccus endophyticus]